MRKLRVANEKHVSQNYSAVEECSLFAEGLERGTIMNLMQVQGCVSVDGVGDVGRMNGVLMLRNTGSYLSIMQNHQGFCRTMTPKHTAKIISNHLQRKEEQQVLEVMACPPQSPDLNLAECVWD